MGKEIYQGLSIFIDVPFEGEGGGQPKVTKCDWGIGRVSQKWWGGGSETLTKSCKLQMSRTFSYCYPLMTSQRAKNWPKVIGGEQVSNKVTRSDTGGERGKKGGGGVRKPNLKLTFFIDSP